MVRGLIPGQRKLLVTLMTASLVACGGGGGGDPAPTTGSVSGTVSAAAGTAIDSDTNDRFTTTVSNNTTAAAQSVPSTVVIGGFAAATATGGAGDNFETIPDQKDFYRVTLSANQKLTLNIANPISGLSPDLDLFIYRTSDPNTEVQSSEGTTNTETITVAASDEYFVLVDAFAGFSNYTLSITQPGLSTGVPDADFVPGEVLVRFAPNALPAGVQDGPAYRAAQLGLNALGGGAGRTMRFSLPDDQATRAMTLATLGVDAAHPTGSIDAQAVLRHQTRRLAKTLRQRADVLSADLNYIYQPYATPSDPFYSFQWHYPLINLPQTWDVETGDASTVVAVVDTGVLLGHPDLQGQLVQGYDFISNDSISGDGQSGIDSNPDDPGDGATPGGSSFHGTHVAGTIAARTNNGIGLAGVAWGAQIMPIRVLGKGGGTGFDIIQGVRYAAGLSNDSGTVPTTPASILNLSLGCNNCFSATEEAAYAAVRAAGAIIIAAAGNENTASLGYPASYNGVVSVSAVDRFKARAPYSNFGTAIDVAAPGGDSSVDADGDGYADGVLSTAGDDSTGSIEFVYNFQNGTSMAAPHMAGVVALMKSANPGFITPDQLDTLLSSGAITDDVAGNGATLRDDVYGYGMIDALKAVQAAQGGVVSTTVSVAPGSLNFPSNDSSETLSVNKQGSGTVTVNSITEQASWLAVAATSVDGSGLGDYTVTVSRAGLADGNYPATITINYTIDGTTNETNVPVSMTVGTAATGTGDVGFTWVILVDTSTNQSVATTNASNVNGRYSYSFSNVPVGDYHVIAGSDSDDDDFICDAGESCGGYPTIAQLQKISVTAGGSLTGIDFISLFNVSVGSAAANADGEQVGFSRLPITEKAMD